jgi:divalent metal cation (Fe/Co/Zn/Cd) transporter
MSTHPQDIGQNQASYERDILLVQLMTLVWMSAEAGVAIWAAIRARSVALLGFGVDSGIELLSALIVFLRFKTKFRVKETKAARITGLLLFALAVFILSEAILSLTSLSFRPEPSYIGIALLIAAALVMPKLAARKRMLAGKTGSAALKADSVQSSMCGYLAWIALGGLCLNAVFRISWPDPIAGLLLLPIIVREGWEAMHGKPCDCAD